MKRETIFNLQSFDFAQDRSSIFNCGRKLILKMGKCFFILSVFIPVIAFASIGEDLNNLLDRFFGGNTPTQTVQEVQDTEDVLVPDNPTEDDFLNIKKKIESETKALETLTQQTLQAQQKLWKAQSEKYTLQGQLVLMDQELSILKTKIEAFVTQERSWQGELETITREQESLKALLRVKKEELDSFLKKNYIRNENFGKGETVSVLNWLFSKKSVGQILQKNRQVQYFEQQKKSALIELEQVKKKLGDKQKQASILFHQAKMLKEQIETEKQVLTRFAETKARLMARSEFKEGKTTKEIENYERQKQETRTFLHKLQSALEDMQGKLGTFSEEEVFLFPLPIAIDIAASFHDSEYEKALGKVHKGVDFVAPQGTDIIAPISGTVSKVSFDTNEYGYAYFILDHGEDLFTVYGHVSDVLVNEGQEVAQGDLIAKTGGEQGKKGAGYFTAGPHLHFEVYEKGEHRDPMEVIDK